MPRQQACMRLGRYLMALTCRRAHPRAILRTIAALLASASQPANAAAIAVKARLRCVAIPAASSSALSRATPSHACSEQRSVACSLLLWRKGSLCRRKALLSPNSTHASRKQSFIRVLLRRSTRFSHLARARRREQMPNHSTRTRCFVPLLEHTPTCIAPSDRRRE